jgi:hypothetical protein
MGNLVRGKWRDRIPFNIGRGDFSTTNLLIYSFTKSVRFGLGRAVGARI